MARAFYFPATVRIEADDLDAANELAEELFPVLTAFETERGDTQGFAVAEGVVVGWLGDPTEEED